MGGFDELTGKLENLVPDRLVEFDSRRVSEELADIRQLRAWDPNQSREQALRLLESVQSGELRHADHAARSAVVSWAARLHASLPEHLEQAKGFRNSLRQLDPTAKTRIVDALILETGGDAEGFRSLHFRSGSIKFLTVASRRDATQAIAWLDSPASSVRSCSTRAELRPSSPKRASCSFLCASSPQTW